MFNVKQFRWIHALIYTLKILYFTVDYREIQTIKWSNEMTRLLFILYQFHDVTYGIIAYLRWVHYDDDAISASRVLSFARVISTS